MSKPAHDDKPSQRYDEVKHTGYRAVSGGVGNPHDGTTVYHLEPDEMPAPIHDTNEPMSVEQILTTLENAVALNVGSQGMRGEAPKRSHAKAITAINSLIEQRERAARVDELSRISVVKTGYAGDHYVYQTSFNPQDRIAQLKKGTE